MPEMSYCYPRPLVDVPRYHEVLESPEHPPHCKSLVLLDDQGALVQLLLTNTTADILLRKLAAGATSPKG